MCFKILLIEEDVFIRSTIVRSLSHEEFDIVETGTSLIDTDIDLSSFQLAIIGAEENSDFIVQEVENIKSHNPQCGIVIMDKNTSKEDVINYYKLGMDSFIEKPFDLDLFIYRISSLRKRIEGAGCVRFVGDVKINVGEQMITCGDEQVYLNPSETKLIMRLIDTSGIEVLTKSEINRILYRTDNEIGINSAKVYIYRLRDK